MNGLRTGARIGFQHHDEQTRNRAFSKPGIVGQRSAPPFSGPLHRLDQELSGVESTLAVGAFLATTMITTRSSTMEDAEAVSACVDAVAGERRYLGNTSGFSAEQTRAFIGSLSESGGIQIVVVADAKIVGWCDVTPLPFEGMRHVGRLGMGLLPSFRGQGLGRRLVREALGHVFAKTLQRVELEVFASNKIAVGLYEREGFVMEGRKRRARILDGAEDDILIMGCLRDEWLSSISQPTAAGRVEIASR